MREKSFVASLMFVLFLMAPGLVLSQTAQQSGTLSVSGFSGQAPVIQAGGKSYVDVEALARLTNGSLSFSGNQVMLTLPGSGGGTPTTAPPARPAAPAGFSKSFLNAGIEAMTEVREWQCAGERRPIWIPTRRGRYLDIRIPRLSSLEHHPGIGGNVNR